MSDVKSILIPFQDEIGAWGNNTFGKVITTVGIINHLIKEAFELQKNNTAEEAADCFLLLLQHANEVGYDLLEEAKKKHEINLTREWGEPDEDGVIEHVKKLKKWYFTFGGSQAHANCYYVVEAEDSNSARMEMFNRFGSKWSMQYESAEAAGVDKYGLTEIK